MTNRSRTACISAAVAALLYGGAALHARDLTYDETTLADDGLGGKYGVWDTSTTNWLDNSTTPATNVAWLNSPPDNAILGGANAFVGATPANTLAPLEPITVQDINFGIAANGGTYNISDALGGTLTLAGNVTKSTAFGNPQITLDSSSLTLTAGDHTFAMNDTSGDAAPELAINAAISGPGNVIIDNGAGLTTWGTIAFTLNNSYTGTTTINKGRLEITKSTGLGDTSAGTTIGALGTLSIGGSNTLVSGGLNIAEPITIQRSTYTGGDFGIYPAAIIFNNNGTIEGHTLSGAITLDSADSRIAVNTTTLVLPGGNISFGPNGTGGVLSFTGDYAGRVQLNGANPALATNGIKLVNAVEVAFESDDSLGGATAPITFSGDATLDLTGHPTMTTFGSHPINTTSFGGGVDVPAGQSFTLDQAITGGSGLGKRGVGSLTFNAPITGTGNIYFDGGQVDVNAAVSYGTLHLRSPVVNINNGGSITLTGGNYNSFGADSTGTNGGPDIATVNISAGGSLVQTNGNDFNISDGANTSGTVNISGGTFTTGGITWLGKSNNAVGRLVQTGGTVNINRTGNFGFVIADGRGTHNPTGFYSISAGTMTAAGEVYVGEGGGGNNVGALRGHGNWTQTGGTTNLNNWFVVGRESAVGTFDMSGGVMNHNGGNMSMGDSAAGGEANTVTVHGNAIINNIAGEFWVGTGGGTITNMSVYDTAQITVNNWFPVGRAGAQGTLDVYGNAVITKNGANNAYVGESTNAVTSTMSVRQNAVFNETSGEFWVGQGGGIGILNIQDSAAFSVNNWFAVGRQGGSIGTVNFSGGTITKTGNGFLAIGSGGTGTFNMTGGTLSANGTRLAEASNGIMNITGGSANFTGEFSIGYGGNLVGTLNIGGNANVTVPAVVYGVTGSGTSGGSINLSGTASLTGAAFTVGPNSTGARTFTFDGGTLKPSANSTNFIGAKITSIISTNGATIDTNGKSITVNSALTHDATLAGLDGGLVKLGAGTLKVTGTNTYTGNTTVSAGTLQASVPAALPGYATAGQVSVASGATIAFNYGGASDWSAANVDTARANVTLASGSAIGLDTSNATATATYASLISGPIGVTKLGTGTLALTAANTYTGPTTVSGGTLRLSSDAYANVLTNAGGVILNSSKLVFDYTGTTSPASTVVALLKSSHDSMNFRDPAQTIRTTNPADAAHGLGYYDDGTSALTVAYTWYGDANLDGKINADDYALLDRGAAKQTTGWVNGDFNYDGTVSSADYMLIDTSLGLSGGGSLSPSLLAERTAEFGSAYVTQLIAAVPEPTTLGLVGIAAVAAFGRRRRNA